MEKLHKTKDSSQTERKSQILKTLNITSESIKLEEVQHILEKVQTEDSEITKEAVKKVFNDLDKEGSGTIKSDSFANYLLADNTTTSKILSKSARVLEKLRNLKSKAWVSNDSEAHEDIDWIISVISEVNLYELDYLSLPRPSKISGFETLAKYSQIEEAKRRENDILCINNMRSTSNVKVEAKDVSKRRSTQFSSLISPSMFAKIYIHLSTSNSLEFNIFELDALVDTKTSFYLAFDIFSKKAFFEEDKVDENVFKNFVKTIIAGCSRSHTYHNDIHAGDVLQTLFTIMEQGDLQEKLELNDIEVFSVLVSAFCHDFKHTGTTNSYHINSQSDLAIMYHDSSVLENFSISETFKVLGKPENNVFANFTPEEYRVSRRRIIESILATDMAFHHKFLNNLLTKMDTLDVKAGKNFERMLLGDTVNKTFENQQMILSFAVHSSDISSPAKAFKVCDQWRERVYEEFFTQGEMEKKASMPISLLCDRSTTNTLKSQIGFITFVVSPTFNALVNLLPSLGVFVDNIAKNLEKYRELLEEQSKQGK